MLRHQLDVWFPWKLSGTANFCFLFLFSKMSSSTQLMPCYQLGNNLMRLLWHQLWFLMAIVFCAGFFLWPPRPTLSHAHFGNYTEPILQSRMLSIMKSLDCGQRNRPFFWTEINRVNCMGLLGWQWLSFAYSPISVRFRLIAICIGRGSSIQYCYYL